MPSQTKTVEQKQHRPNRQCKTPVQKIDKVGNYPSRLKTDKMLKVLLGKRQNTASLLKNPKANKAINRSLGK